MVKNITNPLFRCRFIGDDWDQDIEITENIYVDFKIKLDLEDEPNEAEVSLYQLNSGTREFITSGNNQSIPTELWASAHGSQDLSVLFRGEIDYSEHDYDDEWITTVELTSQQPNLRNSYVDPVTFPAGTKVGNIIDIFMEAIKLPVDLDYQSSILLPQQDWLSQPAKLQFLSDFMTSEIALSQSFSGPAFPLLQRFVRDQGFFVYIMDGTLHLSSINGSFAPQTRVIKPDLLMVPPQSISFKDERFVKMATIVESNGQDLFAKKRKKRKKKVSALVKKFKSTFKYTKRSLPPPPNKIEGADQYIEYEVVDQQFSGIKLKLFLQPDIKPDNIIACKTTGQKLFRVLEVEHYGNTESYDEWTTELKCVEHEDESAALLAELNL